MVTPVPTVGKRERPMHELSIQELKRRIRDAIEIADSAPDGAAIRLRKVVEAIIRDVYATKLRDSGTEPLQNLFGPLKKHGLPSHIADQHATFVVKIGNKAAHPGSRITEAEVVSSLQNVLPVLRWYEHERRASARDHDTAGPQETQTTPAKEGPYAGATVILAAHQPDSEIEDDWRSLRNYLLEYGVTVLSNQADLGQGLKHTNALFVQLFSTLDPVDEIKLLYGKFGLEPGSSRVLQWRKVLPKTKIDFDAAILNSLTDAERDFCEGADVRTGLLEVFKLELRGKLEKLRTNKDRPHLYLTFDRVNAKDDEYARDLVNFGRDTANFHLLPEDKEHLQKKDFFRHLNKVSGVVFLYGDTRRAFIEKWIANYDEGKSELKANVRLAALYNAPPEKPEMKTVEPIIILRPDELGTYGSRDSFIPNDLLKYCAELARERS